MFLGPLLLLVLEFGLVLFELFFKLFALRVVHGFSRLRRHIRRSKTVRDKLEHIVVVCESC
jgi:hypothetical protein